MSVKRYDGKVGHCDNGAYVSHEDYTTLETEHKSAILTISAIMEMLGVTEKGSISEQVAALLNERNALAVESAMAMAVMEEQSGCFSAALTEGFHELVMESGSELLIDVYQRRLIPAIQCIPPTPATDAAIASIKVQARIEGAHFVANRMLAAWEAGFIEDTAKNAADIARMILTSTEFMPTAPEGDFDRSFADGVLKDISAQLREVPGK